MKISFFQVKDKKDQMSKELPLKLLNKVDNRYLPSHITARTLKEKADTFRESISKLE